jgi:hypothetical protein
MGSPKSAGSRGLEIGRPPTGDIGGRRRAELRGEEPVRRHTQPRGGMCIPKLLCLLGLNANDSQDGIRNRVAAVPNRLAATRT